MFELPYNRNVGYKEKSDLYRGEKEGSCLLECNEGENVPFYLFKY